jgi:hypothetical protein
MMTQEVAAKDRQFEEFLRYAASMQALGSLREELRAAAHREHSEGATERGDLQQFFLAPPEMS